ncbi:MAG: hypothetical protein RIR62_1072 [Pseudomonadota bacterium]|jgi:hypothetical protein
MTDRARILGLMALKERAAVAAMLARVADLTRRLAEAQAMAARLEAMIDQRRAAPPVARLATDIRSDRILTGQLLAEAARQHGLRDGLARKLAAAQGALAQREHRRDLLADKAGAARQAARDDRQARAEAMLPPRQTGLRTGP